MVVAGPTGRSFVIGPVELSNRNYVNVGLNSHSGIMTMSCGQVPSCQVPTCLRICVPINKLLLNVQTINIQIYLHRKSHIR